ncbi:MAG: hypothetical protein AB8G22_07200 [Saprospiraceae bacterium]
MDLSDSILAQKTKQLFSSKSTIFFVLLCLCTVAVGTQFATKINTKPASAARLVSPKNLQLGSFPVVIPNIKYGFALDTFQVSENIIKNGQFLAEILLPLGMDFQSIETLVENVKPVFDVRRLRVDKPYTVLANQQTQKGEYFIYEPNIYEYIVFDLKNLSAERVEKPVEIVERSSAGVIESSLWNAMVLNGMSFEMAAKMEDALQWSVDFNHVQKGDRFKLLYEQKYIDG